MIKKEIDILNLIPVGSNNTIKRKRLCSSFGLSDRKMRDALHEARKKIAVLNLQNGRGYFIPDMNTEKDIRMLVRWVRQEKSRIKELQETVITAEKTLSNCGVEIDDWR